MKDLINCIFLIWSFSPVLTLTDDDQFDEFIPFRENKNEEPRKWRFSFINIKLGTKILYLFSFTQNDNKLKYTLELSQAVPQEVTNASTNEYREHLIKLTEQEKDVEREALCYRINREQQRYITASGKINIYAMIILTIIAPLRLIDNHFSEIMSSISLRIIVLIVFYSLLNICLYIYGSIIVRSLKQSKFETLRDSEAKYDELIHQYWMDWQYLSKKVDLDVSYVKNLQHWIVLYIVSLIGLMIIIHT